MRKYFSLLFIIIFIFLAACSNLNSAGLPDEIIFRSIDEIIEQPLEVTNFANDGSASLPIHTAIPVACTIVYGTTPNFGSLTLDQDMAGGAHSDHNPLLVGLEAETTYYFRVQGVDESGIIYLSEVMTFTTPSNENSEIDNLASPLLGAEITGYSSAFGSAEPKDRWGVISAFDNNPNTEWSSAGDGNDAWIEIKLAQSARIDAISFQSRSMSDGSAITLAFTVTTDTGKTYGPFEVPDTSQPFDFDMVFEAQTLRFDLFDTTGGNTGVVDIAISGEFVE